jgi:hypothetical protein
MLNAITPSNLFYNSCMTGIGRLLKCFPFAQKLTVGTPSISKHLQPSYMRKRIYTVSYMVVLLFAHFVAHTTPPTTTASGLFFNSVDGGSMRLNWTNGNGARRIVIMRASAPVTATPVNGTDYLSDESFGVGQAVAPGQFVVFDGTNTYADVRNLQPATVYHFAIYEYNGSNATTEYMTTAAVASNSTLLPPSTQADSLAITNVTGNSMKIAWKNGAGSRRIVLMRKAGPVNANPTDLVNYSGNGSFGSGTEIGSGNFVLFNGVSNSVTVTALSPSSTYHIAVFEANGSSTPVFLTVNPLTGSQQTLPRPTVAASNVNFAHIAATTMRVAWTDGNGARRIVVMRAGSAVTAVPADGVDYLNDGVAAFNSAPEITPGNKVVFDNASSTLDATGLQPNTTYYFKIFEYDGTGSAIAYQTASFGAGSQSTLAIPTTQASNLTFSNITGNSVTLTWTSGNGSKRVVLAKQGTPVDTVPVDLVSYSAQPNFGLGSMIGTGNYVVHNASGNSVTVTGLNTSTTYHFAVFEANGLSNSVYNITSPAINQVTTADRPTSPSSALGSTQIEGNSMRLSWIAGNGIRRIVVARANAPVDAVPQDGVDYLNPLSAAFNAAPEISAGQKVIYDNAGSFADVTGLTTGNVYHFKVFECSGTGTGTTYLTTNPASGSYATVAAPTTSATALVASNISSNGLTLTWTNGNGARRIVIAKQGSPVDALPVNYTYYSSSPNFTSATVLSGANRVVYSGSGNTVTLTHLNLNTTYHFAVIEYNGSIGPVYQSQPHLIGSVTTTSAPTLAPGNPTFSIVDGNKMRVSWSSGNGTRRIVVARAGSPVDAVPVNGVDYLTSATNTAPFNSAPEISAGQKVVYDNAGDYLDVTGLQPNTTYHFRIYEYSGTGSEISYLTSSFGSGSQATISAPTVQASNLSFTSVTSNSLLLSWTNGNGVRRLIIGKKGSAVDATPVDLTAYSGSTAFGLGNQLGSGNFVISANNVGNVTVTGLLAGTTYHFAVFEYNGTDGPLYLKPAATGVATTIGAPSGEATSAHGAVINQNSALLGWTNGSGNKRLVLMKKGGPVDAIPVNNASYFGNSFFGSGTQIGNGNYVVFNGIQNSVTVTNLESLSNYHFAVFEYNEFGATSQFLTNNPARAMITTSVLPVTLTGFKGRVENGKVKLEWTTLQELNSDRFEVERSGDGRNFTKVGHVLSAGTSSTRNNYQFIDVDPLKGKGYYRLKQVDRDRTAVNSNVVSVSIETKALVQQIITAHGTIKVQLSSTPAASTTAMIFDETGKALKKVLISSQQTDIDISGFPQGIYIVEITTRKEREASRFLKQ